MSQSPSSNAPLAWAAPAWANALAAAATLFAAALALFTWAASDFRGFDLISARILAWPSALGVGLAGFSIAPRLKRGALDRRGDVIWRAAAAMGASGFAWPLSFGAAALIGGDAASALAALAPAFAGLVLGAISGGAFGAIAARLFLRKAPAATPPR